LLPSALRRGFASSAQRSKTSGAGGGGGLAAPCWNRGLKGTIEASKIDGYQCYNNIIIVVL